MEIIRDLKARELVPGITGFYRHGEQLTLGLVVIKAGTSLPVHEHMHEQITYMIEGKLQMTIGAEQVTLTPGAVQVIPSHVIHSAFAITDCQLIDVFNPVREDYR